MKSVTIPSGLAMIVLSLWLVPTATQAEALSRAMMLSNSCMGCHGPGGASPGAIPSIAGKSADFIEQALTKFRSGERPATIMQRHAKGYTDEEIRLIADYFSAAKP